MTREQAIEVMAREIYTRRNGFGCAPWNKIDKGHKDEYRSDAHAAISALEAAGWKGPETKKPGLDCSRPG